MKRSIKAVTLLLMLVAVIGVLFIPTKSFAAGSDDNEPAIVKETNANDVVVAKAVTATIVVALVAAVGAIGMALTVRKASDASARQPEIAGRLFTMMMLGCVFIETAIIYALIVAIFIVFIL
ncbi:MAG: ATP synthase F0 subunit C [Lachnospiraceae bacterium]|nr:ATP synthase F0 subunit C [Lachnospiraceae bacterium]